ncbi:MAG TPA: hypothetical protein VJ992_11025 [Gemmatimonadales bacterium]|nr:hypothetical protein [Gemmatimonadales bacterium]
MTSPDPDRPKSQWRWYALIAVLTCIGWYLAQRLANTAVAVDPGDATAAMPAGVPKPAGTIGLVLPPGPPPSGSDWASLAAGVQRETGNYLPALHVTNITDANFSQGLALYLQHKAGAAKVFLEMALQRDSGSYLALTLLGYADVAMKDDSAARALAATLAARAPRDWKMQDAAASIALDAGAFDAADRYAKNAVSLDPNAAPAWAIAAHAAFSQDRLQEADNDYSRAAVIASWYFAYNPLEARIRAEVRNLLRG